MSDDNEDSDGELQFGVAENSLADDPDDQTTPDEESPTIPSSEVESRGQSTQNPLLDGENRAKSDPFDGLPDDLNLDSLSASGAAEVAALDAGDLYTRTTEPYSFTRNGAHDQRTHHGIFLRESVSHAVDNVHGAMSHLYDDEAYFQADTLELLIMVALRHVDELPDVAADLGFGMNLETYMEERQD